MTDSPRSVSYAHSLQHGPSTSSCVDINTHSGGAQRRVIVEGVACSHVKPPRYPRPPSQSEQNRSHSDQRLITRRRRDVSSTGAVVSSGTENADVPRETAVREPPTHAAKEVHVKPLHTARHAHSACQSDCPVERMKARSSDDSLRRVRVHEWVKGRVESATWTARERERKKFLEEEFSLRLSVWKAESQLRKMREDETKQDAEDFDRSGVYAREQHQRSRYWTSSRVRNNVRGFADIALVNRTSFGVWERLHVFAAKPFR